MREIDVLIVGGGQAGLATAYYLKKANISFLIVEKHKRLGDNWRLRYDSLVLFATRRYSHIPGLKMKGDQAGYPGKDEVADYMEDYAKHFDFAVEIGSEVTRSVKKLDKYHTNFVDQDGNNQEVVSRAVVVATGGFQKPSTLKCASDLDPDIPQFTAESYRRPAQIPEGEVLVVGDGATGRQVAKELAETHSVTLATGKRRPVKPQQIFGKDYFWWLDKLGLLKASKNSWVGRYMQTKSPFPGKDLSLRKLKQLGIRIADKVASTSGEDVRFESGNQVKVNSVIWAIGYHFDHSWLELDNIVNEKGELIEERGVSTIAAGLYCIGKPWQWTRGSATLTGVGDDARHITDNIIAHLAFFEEVAEFNQLQANPA